jgi:membrane dipeptidase
MTGGLNAAGRDLLREMDRLGMILDVTHLSDDSFWDALDIFNGPIWASHSNCRHIAPDVRQFSDEQIKALIDRQAVLGMVFDAWMMIPGWIRGTTTPADAALRIEHICDHIDHIAQLAGHVGNIGIGSDLDGGYGTEQTPTDLDTIADLTTLRSLLIKRGYTTLDTGSILSGNYISFLRKAWSKLS